MIYIILVLYMYVLSLVYCYSTLQQEGVLNQLIQVMDHVYNAMHNAVMILLNQV